MQGMFIQTMSGGQGIPPCGTKARGRLDCILAEMARSGGVCMETSRELMRECMPAVRLLYPDAVLVDLGDELWIAGDAASRRRLQTYFRERAAEHERKAAEHQQRMWLMRAAADRLSAGNGGRNAG